MSNSNETLNALILSLEDQRKQDFQALKQQLKETGESLKPVNLIKSAVGEVTDNKELKSFLIQAGIGIVVSLITKKVISSARQSNTANLVGNVAALGLKRLTPTQAAIIRLAAPVVIGFVLKSIQRMRNR
ncbi:MAG: hypothetical protein ABIQ02_10685 [Saprospiraceae bacterium]